MTIVRLARHVAVSVCLVMISCWSVLVAQPSQATQNFSVVVSEKSDGGKRVAAGAKIFDDKDHVFKKLPSYLSGMDYLVTSMRSRNRIIPLTEGYVYMVTPLAGQEGSQEQQLIAMGFVRTEHPALVLFKGQKQQAGVFKKYIAFERFRLGHIEYDGWAVPFFKKRELPSVTTPASFKWMPGDEYSKDTRRWQGCPSIEITGNRLWGTWFSGGDREPDKGNYGIISYSDDGKNWLDPAMIIYHTDTNVRVMDTELWKDPHGRLWIFWTQNTGAKGFDGFWGTWAIYTENPEANIPEWTSPRRLCNGLTRNKPTVLSTGEWLLPSYDWIRHQSAIYVSKDEGKSWRLQGGPINEPVDNFYEHMTVQLKNGDVWMLQRNIQGSISRDKGVTWSPLDTLPAFTSANSRLYLGRLRSGRLLLIYNNDSSNKRRNLTAFLSEDEGKTWPYRLVLDERDNVSYPEAVQDADNRIYVCYDRSRTGEKEILLAIFSEEDIMKGAFISESSEKKKVISKGGK